MCRSGVSSVLLPLDRPTPRSGKKLVIGEDIADATTTWRLTPRFHGRILSRSTLVMNGLSQSSNSSVTAGSPSSSMPPTQPSFEQVRGIGAYDSNKRLHQEQGNASVAGHVSDVTALSVPRSAQAIRNPRRRQRLPKRVSECDLVSTLRGCFSQHPKSNVPNGTVLALPT